MTSTQIKKLKKQMKKSFKIAKKLEKKMNVLKGKEEKEAEKFLDSQLKDI